VSQLRAEAAKLDHSASVREFLGVYGIGPSSFKTLIDGRPVSEAELDLALRILLRLRDVKKSPVSEAEPAKLAAEPDRYRGERFALSGRLAGIGPVELSSEQAERFETKHLYLCEIRLDGVAATVPQKPNGRELPSGQRHEPPGTVKQRALVYTDTIPRALEHGGATGEAVTATGAFLKFVRRDAAESLPVFVAPRLAWHPATPLGELGVDAGLLDDVKDRAPWTAADREPFYEMLAAARAAPPGRLLRTAQESAGSGRDGDLVAALFAEPDHQRGRLIAVSGTVARVVRVAMEDAEAAARFGLDHYYEIDLLTADSQQNPLVFCTASLPEGMPESGPPAQAESIHAAGFFLKVWGYPLAAGDGPAAGCRATVQWAPVLVGQTPQWQPGGPARRTSTAPVAAVLLAMALIGLWLLLGHLRQSDREFEEAMTHVMSRKTN
jgi:hypothetical protein